MIVANFKANGNSSFIHKWHEEFIQVASKSIFSSVGVAPSHIHFYKLNKLFKETSVRLGMQNIDEEGGARTGSISAEMASEIGCSFLIHTPIFCRPRFTASVTSTVYPCK